MTNKEKAKLRYLAKQGLSISAIREEVNCSDATIRRYIRVFSPTQPKTKGEKEEGEGR
jgi:IS30 family transposase